MVDDEDFERVSQFKWHVYISGNKIYAVGAYRLNGRWTTRSMHRFIMGVTDKCIQVDHIFHNGLDNRKENLRLATNSQNQKNSRIRKSNTAGYKGVYFNDGKFCAAYLNVYLGRFDCPKEAARHYNKAAKQQGEGFELLNDVEPMFPTAERITRKINNERRVSETVKRTEKYLFDVSEGLYKVRYEGVYFQKRIGRWTARVKGKHIGTYLTQSEAIEAQKIAKKTLKPEF